MNSLITRVNDMDRIFNQIWESGLRPVATGGPSVLRPRVDIEESGSEYRVRMDLPGVAKEDLRVEIENDTLLIEAERKTGASEDVQMLHRERAGHVRFSRSFTLGEAVKAEQVSARLQDGVLELTLPKAEKALPRRISVE